MAVYWINYIHRKILMNLTLWNFLGLSDIKPPECWQIGSCHFLPEASFGLQVLWLPASVCVSVCVCQSFACPRDNSGLVQARITKFGPQMQKTLVKFSIVLWTDRRWPSRSNLIWKSKFTPFWACPHHNSPPNLDQRCKIPWLRSLLFWEAIDLDL